MTKNTNTLIKVLVKFWKESTVIILLFVSASVFLFNSCASSMSPDEDNVDGLVRGLIAYNIPDTMEIERNYKATVSITKALNDSILFEDLNRKEFLHEEIRISSRVKVILIDPTGFKNFEITTLNTEEQLVDDSSNTVWNWNIIPIRGGENELIVRASVKILNNLGENYKDITVFEKTIKVKTSALVSIKHFFSKYWQWLTTVCFIPLIIWSYKKFTERNKKGIQN